MTPPLPTRSRGQSGGWTFAVLAVLASAAALASHLLTANLRDNPGARFEDQLDGTASQSRSARKKGWVRMRHPITKSLRSPGSPRR